MRALCWRIFLQTVPDANIWKREIGIGFKPSPRLVAKLVHQQSLVSTSPAVTRAFAAAQLSVVF